MDVRLTRRVNRLVGLGTALRRETRHMTEDVAKDVLTQAQANIREMGAYRTGAMHDSGAVVPVGDDRFRVVFPIDYALPVHEGHRTRNGGFVVGRPFLSTAIEAQRPNLQARGREAIRRAVG
jgi:hypothetical protein